MTARARPSCKRTRDRLSACEAVGLHYWADHPAAGHVWAVDDQQRAHVVRILPDGAEHVCRKAYVRAIDRCDGADFYTSNLLEDRDIQWPPNNRQPSHSPR